LEFQNQHNLVSPDSEGESLLSIIFELEGELAKSDAELGQASSYLSADAPKIKALKTKARALRQEIELQKRRVTGEQQAEGVLNQLGLQYQSLLLDVELATTLYTSALSAYELARVQAGKQLKYLVVAAEPELADEAGYPRRFYWLLTTSVAFVLLFGIFRMMNLVMTEHKD
jgi:capsular polysaccharide transport system permease protein